VMGMPHRGRLNVLAHTLRKPYELILGEFEGSFLPWDIQGDGDVKYHLGYSHDHIARNGRTIHLSMSANPSHLEAINPVVEGIVRAKQAYLADGRRKRVVPVLMHGDAAFMGQGSVYETLMLSELPSFTAGGRFYSYGDGYVEIPVEIWTYNFGPYKLMRQIRFVDGVVDEIESLGYGYHETPSSSAETRSERRETYR